MKAARLFSGAGLALVPLVWVLLGALYTWPLESASQAAQEQQNQLVSQVKEARARVLQLRHLAATVEPVAQQVEPLMDRLVDDVKKPPRFLPLFSALARNSGVRIRTCRWSTARKDLSLGAKSESDASSTSPIFTTVSFFITVRGAQENILNFLGALESNPRPITVAEVDIKRKHNPRRPLEARIRAEVVVRARS